VLKYIERVCEKHDLYKDIQLRTRIKSAQWLQDRHAWVFNDEAGAQYRTRCSISCMGFLSQATLPAIPDIEDFRGQSFHTSEWPRDIDPTRDFAGKKVGVIGTGATGIQVITALSKQPDIRSIIVFQRTANWSALLRSKEMMYRVA
jgi:cation diffusion facilitator CzcD-associated flavoprotein CzcO